MVEIALVGVLPGFCDSGDLSRVWAGVLRFGGSADSVWC